MTPNENDRSARENSGQTDMIKPGSYQQLSTGFIIVSFLLRPSIAFTLGTKRVTIVGSIVWILFLKNKTNTVS